MKKSLLKILAFFVVLVASLPIFLVATNFKVYADGHEHDEITSEWDSDNSLPSSYGNYYLTKDVTISSTWYPSRGVKLCLNGHSITMTGEGSVICIHGEGNAGGDYPVSIYDCSDVEHKYRINEEGLAVVDDTLTENYETFKGGYITGGNSADDGGCINIYHEETELRTSTNLLSLNGVNLVGNKAAKRGGAIYSARSPRKNCIIYLNDVSIIGNVAGDTAGAIYHESNNKWLAINSANISKNTSTNAPAGIFEESEISVRGKVYIFDNKLTNGVQSDIVNTHANQDKFTVSGKLEEGSRIGYTLIKSQKIRNYYKEFDANDPTKNNDADPNTIFISNSIHSLVRAQDSKDDLQVLSVIAEEYTTHYDGNPHSIYFINDVESINGTIKYRTEKYGE